MQLPPAVALCFAAGLVILLSGGGNGNGGNIFWAVLADDECASSPLKISSAVTHRRSKSITIAHRGASAHVPEHTLAAYRLALELGADYIQPDLLATSDGYLVAMHTADLSRTTDVEAVYPDRQWYSPWVDRSAYWVFNFTYEELRQLRVRQDFDETRTTMYDYVFRIPTLEEILRVLAKWNTYDLPNMLGIDMTTDEYTQSDGFRPTTLELAQAGLYIELKDAEWLKEEANLDMSELLLDHIEYWTDEWAPLQTCYGEIPPDQFRVPPLVIQSFDADALQEIHDSWEARDTLYNNVAEPKFVLLTDDEDCFTDEFWTDVGRDFHSFLDGIGAEKSCLLDADNGPTFLAKADELQLPVHSYTQRPEQEYVQYGNDVFEETQYLFCNKNAHGIFSESVSTAVLVASLPCPGDSPQAQKVQPSSACPTPGSAGGSNDIAIGVGSFLLGAVVAGVFMYFVGERRKQLAMSAAAARRDSAYHDRPSQSAPPGSPDDERRKGPVDLDDVEIT